MDGALEEPHSAVVIAGLLEGAGDGLSSVIDELAYGVLLVSAKGRIYHANRAARYELARRHLVVVQEGRLRTADAAHSDELLKALAKAETGRRSLVTLRCPARKRQNIAVVPLRTDRGHEAPIAVILPRASMCDAVMLCLFARTHGLTAAEEQVLAILCQGYTAPDAARQLNVAVSTVRSHIRSMCAKTNSNGVRTLVGQVAVLPPIGPALLLAPFH